MSAVKILELASKLKRRQIVGSYAVSVETAKVLKVVVNNAPKWNDTTTLLNQIKISGKVLVDAQPIEIATGNIVRRVLSLVREVCARSTWRDFVNAALQEDHTLQVELAKSGEEMTEKERKDTLKNNVIEAIREMVDEIETASTNLASQASDYIHTNEIIMTIGKSVAVERFLIHASASRKFQVIIAETTPSYQGQEMALTLAQNKIDVTVITDAAIYAMMSRVNKLILGTHAVLGNGGLVAVSGSQVAAVAAKHHSVPVVVLTEVYKVSVEYPFDTTAFNLLLSPDEIHSYEDGDVMSAVEILNPQFDYVKPEMISLYITNDGVHTTSYISRLLNDLYNKDDFDLEVRTEGGTPERKAHTNGLAAVFVATAACINWLNDKCRNEMLNMKGMKPPTATKTGTTIDGLVLGADTRATEGPIVADKNCEKIHYLAPNMYCCGAGTAADTEFTTALISSRLELHRLNTGRQARVVTALTMLKQMLFRYQGHIGAALILGGFDVSGPQLFTIYPHGSTDKLPFVTMGSGSLAAMAVFESKWKKDMTKEEAVHLVSEAIEAGIFNDLGSGSNVDCCVITKDHTEYLRNYKTPNVREPKERSYKFPKGTTSVLTTKIRHFVEVIEGVFQLLLLYRQMSYVVEVQYGLYVSLQIYCNAKSKVVNSIGSTFSMICRLQQRRFASKLINNTPGMKRKEPALGDKRYQMIKDMLYGKGDPPAEAPRKLTLFSERAWSLLKVREAKAEEEALLRKYRAMRLAMEELKKTDERLFAGAMEPNDPLQCFPRRLRVPTETPPSASPFKDRTERTRGGGLAGGNGPNPSGAVANGVASGGSDGNAPGVAAAGSCRYSREFILSLYDPSLKPPPDFVENSHFTVTTPLEPLANIPLTELETKAVAATTTGIGTPGEVVVVDNVQRGYRLSDASTRDLDLVGLKNVSVSMLASQSKRYVAASPWTRTRDAKTAEGDVPSDVWDNPHEEKSVIGDALRAEPKSENDAPDMKVGQPDALFNRDQSPIRSATAGMKGMSIGDNLKRAVPIGSTSSAAPNLLDSSAYTGLYNQFGLAGGMHSALGEKTNTDVSGAGNFATSINLDPHGLRHSSSTEKLRFSQAAPLVNPPGLPITNWFYRDPSGSIQGPFSTDQMQDWYGKSYFSEDLPIKRDADAVFEPLSRYLLRYGRDRPFYEAVEEADALLAAKLEQSRLQQQQQQLSFSRSDIRPLGYNELYGSDMTSMSPSLAGYGPFVGNLGGLNAGSSLYNTNRDTSAYAANNLGTRLGGGLDAMTNRTLNGGLGGGNFNNNLASPNGLRDPLSFANPSLQPHSAALFGSLLNSTPLETMAPLQGATNSFADYLGTTSQPISGLPIFGSQRPESMYSYGTSVNPTTRAQESALHQRTAPVDLTTTSILNEVDLNPRPEERASEVVPAAPALPDAAVSAGADSHPENNAAPAQTGSYRGRQPSPVPDAAPEPRDDVVEVPAPKSKKNKAEKAAAKKAQPPASAARNAEASKAEEAKLNKETFKTADSPEKPSAAPVWGTEHIPKPSLKEIQEAEAREREEREKERAKRAHEQILAQAQALAEQEAAAGGWNAGMANAVWSAPPKTATKAKSTLASIMQEEEERRKREEAAAASASAAVASLVGVATGPVGGAGGRRYADSIASATHAAPAPWSAVPAAARALPPSGSHPIPASKPAVVVASGPVVKAQTQDSAWNVVGKTQAKPPIATPVAVKAPTPNRPLTMHAAQIARPGSASGNRPAKEGPSAPFLQWCKQALRPLEKSGVNVEEFVQILLLSNESQTTYSICDDTLGGLTAIDPRKFAEEFMKRRKMDATDPGWSVAGSVANPPAASANVGGSSLGRFESSNSFTVRRTAVLSILKRHKVVSMIELGCGEGNVISIALNDTNVNAVVGVDILEERLLLAANNCAPNDYDRNNLREQPITLYLYHGSLTTADDRLLGYDGIICTEVIEHLDPPVLAEFPRITLGIYRPRVLVVTTPNAEFNVSFPDLKYGTPEAVFRDDDHRFEWTRREFQEWASEIAESFGYGVSFSGVGGKIFSEKEQQLSYEEKQLLRDKFAHDVGHATQIATFTRESAPASTIPAPQSFGNPLRLLSTIEFPYCTETGFTAADILDEIRTELPNVIYLKLYYSVHETSQCDENAVRHAIAGLWPAPGTFSVEIEGDLWSKLRVRQMCKRMDRLLEVLEGSTEFRVSEDKATALVQCDVPQRSSDLVIDRIGKMHLRVSSSGRNVEGVADQNAAKVTVHISFRTGVVDRSAIYQVARGCSDFKLIGFYTNFVFVVFNSQLAAETALPLLAKTPYITSCEYSRHAYSVPYPQPMDEDIVPSNVLHITHLPSNFAAREIQTVGNIFKGYAFADGNPVDFSRSYESAQSYSKYCYIHFSGTDFACAARRALRAETNLVVVTFARIVKRNGTIQPQSTPERTFSSTRMTNAPTKFDRAPGNQMRPSAARSLLFCGGYVADDVLVSDNEYGDENDTLLSMDVICGSNGSKLLALLRALGPLPARDVATELFGRKDLRPDELTYFVGSEVADDAVRKHVEGVLQAQSWTPLLKSASAV
ncbi:proteasome core particle subunit beta 2 [Irineochytrium annulatum]|nr:proteasome core particle subunit beta 2 [Irineochytrium annulatum]